MRYFSTLIGIIFFIFIFLSCSDSENTTSNSEKAAIEIANKMKETIKPKQDLIIEDHALGGIATGDEISNHTAMLTKTILKTGEGDFEAYKITNKIHGEVGYLLPDPRNTKLVGNIFISNPQIATKDGLRVGSTMADLLRKNPELEVHGSEIEGRTNAMIGNHYFLIDARNFTYDIDKNKIPKDTKVLEIMIQS